MTVKPMAVHALAQCVADGWCTFVRSAINGEAHFWSGGSLGMGGEDFADMNVGHVHGPKDVDGTARRCVARIRERRLPGVLVALSAVATTVAGTADALDLEAKESGPLMCARAGDLKWLDAGFSTQRVSDPASLHDACVALDDAYEAPPGQAARMLGPGFLETPLVDLFVAQDEGRTVSVAATVRLGTFVGIYTVGTRHADRLRGAASQALSAAIAHHAASGADVFGLESEASAEPLYAALGFTPVDRPRAWLVQRV